jgi:hypothetical protein
MKRQVIHGKEYESYSMHPVKLEDFTKKNWDKKLKTFPSKFSVLFTCSSRIDSLMMRPLMVFSQKLASGECLDLQLPLHSPGWSNQHRLTKPAPQVSGNTSLNAYCMCVTMTPFMEDY